MRWKEQIVSLPPYKPGKSIAEVKKQFGLSEIVKLASNENPFGCSKKVIAALKDAAVSLALYPDGYASELRQAVAAHVGAEPNELIFGNGSDEIIQIISRALLQSGTNSVMAAPTFPQYRHNAIIEGAELREIPLIDGDHDLEGMLQAVDKETRVVWLCSPNNPTGTYITRNGLLEFMRKISKDILVVLDEAYYEYVTAEDYYDSLQMAAEFQNLVILRTFSKIYGIAGLRVGYGVGSPDVIRSLEPAREPFNTNSLAQLAAMAALSDQEFVQECKQKNREGIEQFEQFCKENDLHYYPSQGNFLLIDFQVDGNEVFQFLLERGYIVRSGQALGFPTSIRITVGSKEQNEGAIRVLKQFLTMKSALPNS